MPENKTQYPYPIKDWKNKNEYPDSKKTSPNQWAWEFLRRNPEYQKAYDNRANLDQEQRREALEKFGVMGPDFIAPREKERVPPFDTCPRFISLDHKEPMELSKSQFEEVVIFDLRHPPENQLEKVSRFLKNQRKYMKKEKLIDSKDIRLIEENYPFYLRILDAKASGISTKEIGAVLFPKCKNESPDYNRDQQVKNGFKAAKKKRDLDYLFLAKQKGGHIKAETSTSEGLILGDSVTATITRPNPRGK